MWTGEHTATTCPAGFVWWTEQSIFNSRPDRSWTDITSLQMTTTVAAFCCSIYTRQWFLLCAPKILSWTKQGSKQTKNRDLATRCNPRLFSAATSSYNTRSRSWFWKVRIISKIIIVFWYDFNLQKKCKNRIVGTFISWLNLTFFELKHERYSYNRLS
jgi:hypothetical protein